ncbi:MAG: enhanced serine sensitivity protein SseB C-terminal domain-containing protein [Peptococcaceae bacterium]|jgi:hypothetical protein|nr:enhanced serine sensitivity protein SseB C-terminal domain-containing protein [Peptococcaceae bacterium]
MERYVLQKESQVWIGQPIGYPHELVHTLAKVYTCTAVKRAFLAHCCDQVTGGHASVVMELDHGGDAEQVMAVVCAAIQDVPVPDPPVDFIFFTAGTIGTIENSLARAGIMPFYDSPTSGGVASESRLNK